MYICRSCQNQVYCQDVSNMQKKNDIIHIQDKLKPGLYLNTNLLLIHFFFFHFYYNKALFNVDLPLE